MAASTETAYASNQTSAEAPLKAQVELTKLENEEILLTQERETHLSHLKALLNHPPTDEINLPKNLKIPSLKKSLGEIQKMTDSERPEIRSAEAMEKSAKSKLTSAKQSLIPDFSFAFEYNQRPLREDAWTGTAMVNLPIFFWGKQRGEIQEAKALLNASRAEHESLLLHTKHDLQQAYGAVKAAEKIDFSYTQKLLPQAKTMLEATKTAYASGKVDFMTVLDATRTYREIQMNYYGNKANRGMAYARLERLVGHGL